MGNRVAVDMYHVPVPGLYGASKPFHLIAFKEDSESRMQPEAPEEVLQDMNMELLMFVAFLCFPLF